MQRDPQAPLAGAATLAWSGFVLDLARGELFDEAGRPTELRAQALKVLLALGEQAGQVVGKDDLMQRVWGDVVVTEDSLVQAIGDIRRVLGDQAHARIRTVPRRGYLLAVEAPAPAAQPGQPAPESPPVPPAAKPSPRWPRWVAGGLLLAAVIGIAAWWMQPHDDAPPRSLAILPFEGEAAAEDWFVDGVTGDLTAILATWPEATVIGRGSTAGYKGKAVDPRDIGRELGVRYVLTGRARREGDQVRLAVSLIDARSGKVAWSELRDVPRAELSALVGDVAGGIARTLLVEFGDAVAADAQALGPQQARADDLAMQGTAELLRSVSREGWERSRQLFEEAVRLDPQSPRGLSGVALVNANLVLWDWTDDRQAAISRAEEALARADLIAPDLIATRLARASVAHLHRDYPGLLVIGDELVAQFPNDPTSHHHRCSALLRLGRFEESLAACARAARISPRDSRVSVWQGLSGFNQFQLGRHAEAEQSLRQSVLANPRVPFYGVVLAAAVAEQGRRDEAVKLLAETTARHPTYNQASMAGFWVAPDARFIAGRDRLIAVAGELGLPP
ncbi:MAG: winged helix-turn-helix domain-containing protein [Rubrivivax sp.]